MSAASFSESANSCFTTLYQSMSGDVEDVSTPTSPFSTAMSRVLLSKDPVFCRQPDFRPAGHGSADETELRAAHPWRCVTLPYRPEGAPTPGTCAAWATVSGVDQSVVCLLKPSKSKERFTRARRPENLRGKPDCRPTLISCIGEGDMAIFQWHHSL